MKKGIAAYSLPLKLWVYWLGFVNLASIFFLPALEAFVVLSLFLLSGVFMIILAGRFGFRKILGLPHLLFFVPMLLFLGLSWPAEGPMYWWIIAVIASNSISLVFDIRDVSQFMAKVE